MGRIIRLDPLVSSQIAAGEVVERPASVVKELVENSIDAGAARIIIDFEESGLSLLRVSDNGSGMLPDDAPLSVERFATSKLFAADDLSHIASLGFRGEALPSIASCSRLTLETRAEGQDAGIEVLVEGGAVISVSQKGLPKGTTVTVRDLFFNTPARLRFVKSHSSERQAIIDAVMRLALAWPDVAFTLRTNDKTVLATSGQGLKNALADVFGPEEASAMAEIRPSDGVVSVSGFTGSPSAYRRQRDRQFISVNGRPVRDAGLGWSLDNAYAGLIPPKTYPAVVLDIRIPPQDIDVNVHPTKSQVKFRDDRGVKRWVTQAIEMSLSETGLRGPKDVESVRVTAIEPPGKWSVVRDARLPFGTSQGRPAMFEPRQKTPDLSPQGYRPAAFELKPQASDPSPRDAFDQAGEWEYLGSVADTYLLASTGVSVLIVDKHALMESLVYRAMLQSRSGSQDLLMAEMVRLDPKESAAYEDYEEAVAGLGFGCRMVGDRTVMVTSVPMVLGRALEAGALKEILGKLNAEEPNRARRWNPGETAESGASSPERLLDSARLEVAACHASVRAREPLTRDEACSLLRALQEQPQARTCPHGRPVARELTMRELDQFFGRTSHGTPERV